MVDSAGNRCILFIDGNNWYHGLKAIAVDSGWLDYRKVADKLLLGRELRQIRYYVGKVSGNLQRSRSQARFLERLRSQGIHIELGRIERNKRSPDNNPVVSKLKALLDDVRDSLPEDAVYRFDALCSEPIPYLTEKQVDVSIAVDLVEMAHRDEYDTAYLFSADGDFVPAVKAVRRLNKKVFAVGASSPERRHGRQLEAAANTFIPLKRDWFAESNLYLEE